LDKLIKSLLRVEVKDSRRYQLSRSRELCLKRKSETKFNVWIDDYYQSDLAPKLLVIIKSESKVSYTPALNIKSTLIYGGIASIFIICYMLYKDSYVNPSVAVAPIVGAFGLQLLLAPVMYLIIKDNLLSKLNDR